MIEPRELSSAGHKLGQLIGNWWELDVVYPMLKRVADRLELFLDNRCVGRECRTEKVQWSDADGNLVDYDFVLEFGGDLNRRGAPVAFLESFWRRGARHSKDKARDDTNKLLPMRETYPTARLLAIAACGEFTNPAREYVRTREVDLFFIAKGQIISVFAAHGVTIDYPDRYGEDRKLAIANDAERRLDLDRRTAIAATLMRQVGEATFQGFMSRVIGALTALPQEIRFVRCNESEPVSFASLDEADAFLANPSFGGNSGQSSYRYEVTYSDGFEFSRAVDTLGELRTLQQSLTDYVRHVSRIVPRI